MTMKYPREAIMAVVAHQVNGGFAPVDDRIEKAGVDPYILSVAASIGEEAAHACPVPDVSEVVEAAADVNFLHGVLFGLGLAENEAKVEHVVTAMRAEALDQHFTREHLPPSEEFHEFAKQGVTLLARVNGPFSCETKEGLVTCRDGWLALDADGDPYPVADDVFRKSYALAP